MYSVLIVEDDPDVCGQLCEYINSHVRFSVRAYAGSCGEAHMALQRRCYDVALIDLGLPDGCGSSIVECIRKTGMETKILVLTVLSDREHVLSALKAGADGYLLKDNHAAAICDSILQMMQGGAPMSPAVAAYLLNSFRGASADKDVKYQLTRREVDVLELVARGYSYAEIAGELNLSYHTISSYMKTLYSKLAVGSRGEAVYTALKAGLINVDSAIV